MLQKLDLPKIVQTFTFPWTTQKATKTKWERYFEEQQKEIRVVCILKCQDMYVGYGSLLKKSKYANFNENGIPEINDVWITEEYRRKRYGVKIIEYLEEIARKENYKQVGIGVGLYKDYGAAQKLYVQKGYIPDGLGVTYCCQEVVPGESYPMDDDLVLWFKKNL